MGRRWTSPGSFLLVLLCFGQLLSWLRTEDTHSPGGAGTRRSTGQHDAHLLPTGMFYKESIAMEFLKFYEKTAQMVWNEFREASWNYVTNITQKNQEEMLHKDIERSQHTLYFGTRARLFNTTAFQNPIIRHMLRKVQHMGKAALPAKELREYNKILTYMETMYSMAQVCMQEGPCLYLKPDLEELMATSRDQKELLWAWQGWRDATGRPLRTTFERYVQLSNKVARLNGYRDMGALWRMEYDVENETSNLERSLEQLFTELQPLYLNLHAYVRRALHRHYGPQTINLRGPIPAHLLGSMWAQSWVNILDLALPYPKKPLEDVTKIMRDQHWKPQKMFEEANNFFTSLGMLPLPAEFWAKSMLEKPVDGREVVCHASAWDFYNGHDFRIKKCTEVTIEDLLSIFHQMGHIQYFLQYQNLSVVFRAGANPAFEEAVGSVATLSASSHKHLLNIGLLSFQYQDSEDEVNFLMGIALEKVAFIPFSYLVDMYRWRVFDGTIHKHIYNQEWWSFRLKYQGVCPPISRSEDDFDPGSKYHISASIPYIRYFISLVLQFQFHEALCKASNHVGPLHQCNIYNSKQAGKLLQEALKVGSSQPWPEVLKRLTGKSQLSAKALLTYFKPLMNWLVTENVRHGEILGWPEFTCNFEEREKETVSFLGLELDAEQAKIGQWVLLVLSLVMVLTILMLGHRVYKLCNQATARDSGAYFLGMLMEPHQAAQGQWILLGLCLLLFVCTIGLIIKNFTQHSKKPPWMIAELWSQP
ncbi:angiotensin-converting enzyme-like protein Ace3 [Tenrec ecaudatus]|uniref:angiotensin-converting enzyme-like protein Ace3 n=1 Tax=Tenrec ecaudatus TaxID=94439 RepID=UPI003F5A892B